MGGKKRRRLQILRNVAMIRPPVEEKQDLFFFMVWVENDEIALVQQTPDWPFEATEDNGSLLTLPGMEIAIHVTWMGHKPEPRSELRYKGYLAIMDEIGSRDPKLAETLRHSAFGFAHPSGASVEFHKPQGDDA